MFDSELLTPQEYARYRRCSLRTLDRERALGSGCPYVKIGARILYRRSDIELFFDSHVRSDFRIHAIEGKTNKRNEGQGKRGGVAR